MKNQKLQSKEKFDKRKLEINQVQEDLREQDACLKGCKIVLLHQIMWLTMKVSWYIIVEAVERQATKVLEIFIREFIVSTEIGY